MTINGLLLTLTLHQIALDILQKQRKKYLGDDNTYVFSLPSPDGANKTLGEWVKQAGINKHITWSCARLSFSILLQHRNIDDATIAYLLGHTTTEQVRRTYKRHRPKNQLETINQPA